MWLQMSSEEIKSKEDQEEVPPTEEEIKKALEGIPDLEEEPEEIIEGHVTQEFEEGVDKEEDIEEGQESKYGI